MDGLVHFIVTACVAAVVVAIAREVWGPRGERARFRLADGTAPGAAHGRIIATLGTSRPAEKAGFETWRHRASPGVKGLATGIAALLSCTADTMLQEAPGHDAGTTRAQRPANGWLSEGSLSSAGLSLGSGPAGWRSRATRRGCPRRPLAGAVCGSTGRAVSRTAARISCACDFGMGGARKF
jgi:hypothetical protein